MSKSLLPLTLILVIALVAPAKAIEPSPPLRQTISLDGTWQIAEGTLNEVPRGFDHNIPVPGLADMATPAFAEVGTRKSGEHRQAFWYRRSFVLQQTPPAVRLKLHKAMYGTRVFLNGKLVGEHLPCFTPAEFDLRELLNPPGQPNELTVRVGAHRNVLPAGMPDGADFEKAQYIPGIYDSVELVLSGTPRIANVQAVPEIENQTVRVVAEIEDSRAPTAHATLRIREAASGREVAVIQAPIAAIQGKTLVDVRIPIPDCRLWSPEDPFLYDLEVSTAGDVLTTRFGMRSFRLDPKTGFAVLNGKSYFLRGSNVCIHRFFEDPKRGTLPWNEAWVRKLHRAFKGMNWNALRYCVGFPPEMWYRIADEEGVLIQDEFPIWCGGRELAALTSESLIVEYPEWLRERWNHPCVVIWDAQNETFAGDKTGKAIRAVRRLDLSNRPWDNGWSPPQAPDDVYEAHPYLFSFPGFRFCDFAYLPGSPGAPGGPPGPGFINAGRNPVIVNEYAWGRMDRNGRPCPGQAEFYAQVLGPDNTVEQRREWLARTWAAETEFWRARRKLAGLMHFCGLCYCKPDSPEVVTSDHFTDIEQLTFEPCFEHYLRDAFAPVGIMVDLWASPLPAGKPRSVYVAITSDLNKAWSGTVRLRLVHASETLSEQTSACKLGEFGTQAIEFTVPIPTQTGHYRLIGQLLQEGARTVESVRDFDVRPEDQCLEELSLRKPVTASSSVTVDGVNYPASAAVDGNVWTRWSSEFSDPQWIAVDLGTPQKISAVELVWEAAFGRVYSIEVSLDGETWNEVLGVDTGRGGVEKFRFAPMQARWVRMSGTKRASPTGGYSLHEFRVFR